MDFSRLFGLWTKALTNPAATFASEKNNVTFNAGALNYAIAGLVFALANAIVNVILNPANAAQVAMLPIAIVGYVIMFLIFSGVGPGIFHLLAKLFGGQGKFRDVYYLTSLFVAPLSVFLVIPFVNILANLYGLYLTVIAVREAESLSTAKAAAVVLIPLVLIGLLMVLLMGAAALALAGVGATA